MLPPGRSPATGAVLVLVLAVVLAACGHSASTSSASPAGASTSSPVTDLPVPSSSTSTVDPGTLPQTDVEPIASGASFDSRAAALWDAIVADDPSLGMPAFFPVTAYSQIKAVKDPAADWRSRLVANFEVDVHDLHRQLGADGATAQFIGLDVPDAAVWVTPGQEHNSGPYWRVYGSTLRYSVDGVEHSLPVQSLISWRGEWYVVHLGAIR